MIKILFTNEEGLAEIIFSNRVYVDPDAPTDILITVVDYDIKLRIRFSDTTEVDSFMNDILFECDKINLKEIAADNPELIVSVEEDEEAAEFYNMIDDAMGKYWKDSEVDDDEVDG